jgi:hypothetical protein
MYCFEALILSFLIRDTIGETYDHKSQDWLLVCRSFKVYTRVRVPRRYIFIPKITFLTVIEEKMLVYFWHLSIFLTIMYVFMAIWNILQPFGIFIPILVYCSTKNLATLTRVARPFQNYFRVLRLRTDGQGPGLGA